MLILVEEISEVYCGEIAAAVGLKNTTTADTLCDEKNPVIHERYGIPMSQLYAVAIEPKSQKLTQDKMGLALQKLS